MNIPDHEIMNESQTFFAIAVSSSSGFVLDEKGKEYLDKYLRERGAQIYGHFASYEEAFDFLRAMVLVRSPRRRKLKYYRPGDAYKTNPLPDRAPRPIYALQYSARQEPTGLSEAVITTRVINQVHSNVDWLGHYRI
jgi:hypothetical protein